jgi:5'-3' exonuclease
MGIPYYFRHVAQLHPHVLHGTAAIPRGRGQGTTLYLDFNSIVHVCARGVLATRPLRGNVADDDLERGNVDDDDLERAIIAASVDRAIALAATLGLGGGGPGDLVYVAVDGVPPRAKIEQQRQRRFMSAWRAGAAAGSSSRWDTNAITPGTSFMAALDRALHAHADAANAVANAANAVANADANADANAVANGAAKGARWIVSGADEPGEGEQKMFAHARRASEASASAGTLLMYGLDADLYMLSLMLPAPLADRTFVVRQEDTEDAASAALARSGMPPLQLVSVRQLRAAVVDTMGCVPGAATADAQRVHDYVALCALVGNDFVPTLQCLRVRDGAVELLVQLYAELRRAGGAPLTTCGPDGGGRPRLRVAALAPLLRAIADREDRLVHDLERRYYARSAHVRADLHARAASSGGTGRDDAAGHAAVDESYPMRHPYPDIIGAGTPGWRGRYYRNLCGSEGEESPDAVCRAYLGALAWSFDYMQQAPVALDWHYPHGHAPTALDVYNTLLSSAAAHAPPASRRGGGEEVEGGGMMEAEVKVEVEGSRGGGQVDLDAAFAARDGPDPTTWTPALQLLAVLPPASSHLLPPAAARLHTDLRAGCAHMFPTRFNVCTYMHDLLWQCPPALPAIDARRLRLRLRLAGG